MKLTPTRKPGQGPGPRSKDSLALDVRAAAKEIQTSEKAVYAHISRGTIPYRRRGGRIIFLRAELEAWLLALPGVSLEEARANAAARRT